MMKFIECNTSIPTQKAQTFTSCADNQPRVMIQVSEDEHRMTKDNCMLGKFRKLDKKAHGERKVLIYDARRDNFDVSISTIGDEIFEVKAIACDTFLGSKDFDNQVESLHVQDFKRNYHGKDLTDIFAHANPAHSNTVRTY